MRPLIQVLKDSDADTRAAATKALARIGKAAVPALVEALQRDISSNVRIGSCQALGEMGTAAKDAAPALSAASASDQNFDVRKAAKEAVAKIQRKQ